ncbi:protein REPRESSOR OF SILENCING 3-like [Salvia splendens]|uniref:protein REPRESSOR OF SILENCING 3-like n=1 Tax=Salvia splendens TaxID=180675 RepID=UPI001C26AE0A|nr:protein REPRESSOR OF SILENCING 3-like [Salvia splendens]
MGEKLRLHLGGLGSNVQASDLHKTFTSPQLGEVQSVEIIRTKGRSFAYIEFVPASDKGLAKLFSTYNGCMWKGGRLKLEKAKEDYQCRLRREWMEAAQHETKLPNQSIDADESVCEMPKPKKEDIEKMQLKLFFPKLRKLKVIPLKGTGKHKYSFQRIEVPPLPTHFCDCEEHFVPPEPAKRNHSGLPMPAKRNKTNDHEVDNNGVNEEELNMMKSILDKLLEKEIRSEIVSNEAEPSEEIQHDASLADQCQVDDNEEDKESEEDEEDQESDEDNLVINIVGRSSKRGKLFEDWGQKTSITNQDSLVNEPEALNNTNDKKQEMQRANQIFDNKRKQSVREGKPNDTVPSKKKRVMEIYHDGTGDQVVKNTKPVDKDPGSIRLGSDVAITEKKSSDVASSTKSAWKALVSEKGNTAFNISDILTNRNSATETESGSGTETESGSDTEAENGSDTEAEPGSDSEAENCSDTEAESGSDTEAEPSSDTEAGPGSDTETEPGSDAEAEPGSDAGAKPGSDAEAEPGSDAENEPGSDTKAEPGFNISIECCSNGNNGQQDQSSKDEELKKHSDALSTEQTASEDLLARGASWKRKSSWLQMVADANASAFSLSQVLPDVTFQKQEPQQFKVIDFSSSSRVKQDKFLDKKSFAEDIGEPQRPANTRNLNEDVLTKEQNTGGPVGEQLNSHLTAPVLGVNLVPSNRPMGEIIISETCPFMKSADSMKEWAKSKAALSGSHKRKGKEMDSLQKHRGK